MSVKRLNVDPFSYAAHGDSERLGELFGRLSGKISFSQIRNVDSFHYIGPVYELQTSSTLYAVNNGIVSSNCRCRQVLLAPGALALPWVDYRKIFARLPAAKRRTAVGKSVDILIQNGILTLDEAVLPGRAKSLEEIAAEKGLSAEDMIRAGVDPAIAERAANHPAIDHEAAHRERMRQRITGAIQEQPTPPASVPAKPSPAKPPTEAPNPPGDVLKAGNETLARIMQDAGLEPIAIPDFGGDQQAFQRWLMALLSDDAIARISHLDWAILFAALEAQERLRKMFRKLNAKEHDAIRAASQ